MFYNFSMSIFITHSIVPILTKKSFQVIFLKVCFVFEISILSVCEFWWQKICQTNKDFSNFKNGEKLSGCYDLC